MESAYVQVQDSRVLQATKSIHVLPVSSNRSGMDNNTTVAGGSRIS